MGKLALGIDLGPNSIGWALIDEGNGQQDESQLVGLGVRVFPEGVDNFDTGKEASKNETRRVARGMRRQTKRRARRRRVLRAALIEVGAWPDDSALEGELYNRDPYELRAKALTERLEPHELGRVFLHLGQRRGFLSNRKRDREDKEVKGMLEEISHNEQERVDGGFETIGAWLAAKHHTMDHKHSSESDRVRRRHLDRSQYEDEFEAIWKAQAKHHPELLTDQLKYGSLGRQTYPRKPTPCPVGVSLLSAYGLHGLLFFQRKMYWPKSVVGLCELEPKQKRCARGDRRVQRFRLLQEVNNLRYVDPDTHMPERLSDDQRTLVLEKLSCTREMTFDQIRKALGFLSSVRFNLERGERSRLKGVPIDALFANKNVLGKSWFSRNESERNEIVAALLDNEREDDAIVDRAMSEWGMSQDQALAILNVELPTGYSSLSLMAIEKLLPHLERGLVYMAEDESSSAMHAAGYYRPDQLQRRIFDKLPDPSRVADCPIGDIPNPVVKRALTEVRRVVNAIIREYGRPDEVHIEMARSVQMGKKKRQEVTKAMREREAEREIAKTALREHGIRGTRANIEKYLLWEQQNHECIYTGQSISLQKLFSETGGVEVDHILPRSRTLDDSQMNKTVCLREANDSKGNETPYEWLAQTDPHRYDEVCQRVSSLMRSGRMPYAKYRRFVQKEVKLDNFVARQLTDTGYIARATRAYVQCLFPGGHEVLGLKGQLTAELRWHWGLETILEELPDSPAWHERSKLRPGEKNRADHRHHAIDAVVIALTNRSRLKRLSEIVRKGGARRHGEILEPPWAGFRDDIVDAVRNVKVSHRVQRKVRGKLHEDTVYGKTTMKSEWVVRKTLTDLSAAEIPKIRDDTIRKIVMERLRESGIAFGRATKPDPKKLKEALSNLSMPSGVPIKKVRITKTEGTVREIRQFKGDDAYVKPGSTHHICIFEWQEGDNRQREPVFVTMLEATQRRERGEDIIQRQHPTRPDAGFVMSLSRCEMVLMSSEGEEELLVYNTAASTSQQMTFYAHNDARRTTKKKKKTCYPSTFNARKVTVDPLGQIRWAND